MIFVASLFAFVWGAVMRYHMPALSLSTRALRPLAHAGSHRINIDDLEILCLYLLRSDWC